MIAKGVTFILVAVALLWVTYLAIAIFHSAVPLGRSFELWYVNSDEGWMLVTTSDGLLTTDVFADVRRVSILENELIIETPQGELLRVRLEDGKRNPMDDKEYRRLVAQRVITPHRPGDLKARMILHRYWWVFLTEPLLVLAGFASGGMLGFRRACLDSRKRGD